MPEIWKVAFAIIATSLASVLGTVAIKSAVMQGSFFLAIAGSSLWSLSGAGFAYAAGKDVDMSLLASAASAGSLLIANVIAIWWLAEPCPPTRILALALIVLAIALLAWPATPH